MPRIRPGPARAGPPALSVTSCHQVSGHADGMRQRRARRPPRLARRHRWRDTPERESRHDQEVSVMSARGGGGHRGGLGALRDYPRCPAVGRWSCAHRRRRHRRRGQRAERTGGRRVGDRGDDRSPTRFARSVVTDDQGRYVVPDLPKARYKVWVRGYGLVDSPKVDGEPGTQLNLSAVPAPSAAAAAQYYPAIYWYSMLKIPDADQFGGKSNIPRERHAERLAHRGEESILRRLSSARPAVHPHDPGRARPVRVVGAGVDPPRPVGPGRAARC